jgi:integrase
MSYYIRKTGKNTWSVTQETYPPGSNKAEQKALPIEAWPALGFASLMTIDEAKARAKRLNLERSEEKKAAVRAAKKFVELKITESIYVPKDLADQFKDVITNTFTSTHTSDTKMLSHWVKATHILKTLKLKPTDFASQKQAIFAYFVKNHISWEYVRKLTRILNLWGAFVCRHQGQFWEPIADWTTQERQRINDSYSDSDFYRGPSEILVPEKLAKLKDKFKPEQYRWLMFSVWFGLRPEEIDSLYNKKFPARIEHDMKSKVEVLYVYQSKLVSLPRDKRWKAIPAFLPEQKAALKLFKEGLPMKRPILKTLKAYTEQDKIGVYCGRKGFVDLMLDKGQALEDISMWMGHQNIQMTFERYRNRKRISFTEAS